MAALGSIRGCRQRTWKCKRCCKTVRLAHQTGRAHGTAGCAFLCPLGPLSPTVLEWGISAEGISAAHLPSLCSQPSWSHQSTDLLSCSPDPRQSSQLSPDALQPARRHQGLSAPATIPTRQPAEMCRQHSLRTEQWLCLKWQLFFVTHWRSILTWGILRPYRHIMAALRTMAKGLATS